MSATAAVLRVSGVADAGKSAGMFYQNMLKTTSRAHERDALFACAADSIVHRFRLTVGAAGSNDDPAAVVDGLVVQSIGADNYRVGLDADGGRGMLECRQCRDKIGLRFGQINQDCDIQGRHISIAYSAAPGSSAAHQGPVLKLGVDSAKT